MTRESPREEIFLLGLDLGVSTVKAALFNSRGLLIEVESDEYIIMPEGGKVEADPATYWTPLAAAIRRLLLKWNGNSDLIAAVSVASHTETVIPLDASGEPVRPALVWMDNRSQLEANELSDLVGAARVLEVSGQPEICAIWPLTKFRWLRKNESEHFQRTAKFLLPEDYILYRLCGEIVAEQTAWSSSLVLDIRRKTWSTEMLEFAALSAAQMPQLCAPGTLIGTISEACSAETGLCQSTKVVAGALDQVCAAIGAGNIAPGITTESTGSVLALLATVSEPIFDATSRVPCHIHAVPNTYCLLPWNPTGGLVLKWFKDNFVASDDGDNGAFSKSNLYDVLSREAEGVPCGSEGLLMLPHLGGALFPEYDHTARGVFFGATLSHRRPHFVRAIMEAIAFMIRRDLEGLNRLGAETREIRVLGGGAKSRVWSQIKADVSQVSVVLPAQTEAAALGAAILAAVGAGIYSDIPAAVRNMTRMSEVIRPHTAPKEIYDASYSLYVDLYKHVKELFSQCDRIKELASKQNLLAREAL